MAGVGADIVLPRVRWRSPASLGNVRCHALERHAPVELSSGPIGVIAADEQPRRNSCHRRSSVVTLYTLKPRFQALLRPFVAGLAARGITANHVTIAAACGSLAIGLLVAIARARPAVFLLLPIWLAVRMALNAVDGMLAREFGQMSRLGAYLNELGDALSDAALLFPFAPHPAVRRDGDRRRGGPGAAHRVCRGAGCVRRCLAPL